MENIELEDIGKEGREEERSVSNVWPSLVHKMFYKYLR